jgi:hypothetical protein
MRPHAWNQAEPNVFTTTLEAVQAAGGERKVNLPDSTLRIGDVEWKVTQKDGGTVMEKSIPVKVLRILVG